MTFQPLLPGLLPRPPLCLPPGSHQLWSFPDLSRKDRCRHAKALGLAGECLVDSLLLRYGLSVMRLPEFTAVDRLILHPEQILRLQVKTTTVRQNGGWCVNAHHGYGRSPQGLRPYEPDAFDLLALVVLPENAVFFTAERRSRHRVRDTELAMIKADPRLSLEAAFWSLGLSVPGPDAPVLDAPQEPDVPSIP
ncbi:hypothetical protein [Paenirhodobacter populi]|uniref:PD(D/E)XK endonuclease domain-containing protein n=1 Tax=Paenirhodobacter populi TaxID=2306993 RepID=A0A443J7P2_9RHOB|nr:hypothetical protein [Sinirhodobacter populi]RWR16507.1 hypothetical protein D2T30_21545 [Sinirhodobacter populi]